MRPGHSYRWPVPYEDSTRRVITRSDNVAPGDQQLVFPRPASISWGECASAGNWSPLRVPVTTAGIKVQTRYGYSPPWSYQVVSNPYRAATSAQAAGEATMGWT